MSHNIPELPPAAPKKAMKPRRSASFVSFSDQDPAASAHRDVISALSSLDLAIPSQVRPRASHAKPESDSSDACAEEERVLTSTPSRSARNIYTIRPPVSPVSNPLLRTTPTRCPASPTRKRLLRLPAKLGGVLEPKKLPFFHDNLEEVIQPLRFRQIELKGFHDMSGIVECDAEGISEEAMSIGQPDQPDMDITTHQDLHDSVAMEDDGESLMIIDGESLMIIDGDLSVMEVQ